MMSDSTFKFKVGDRVRRYDLDSDDGTYKVIAHITSEHCLNAYVVSLFESPITAPTIYNKEAFELLYIPFNPPVKVGAKYRLSSGVSPAEWTVVYMTRDRIGKMTAVLIDQWATTSCTFSCEYLQSHCEQIK